MDRRSVSACVLALLLGAGVGARAQEAPVRVHAAQHDTLVVDSTGVVTAAFMVENPGAAASDVQASLAIPQGWNALMGSRRLSIAGGGSEIWLVSVSVPATTEAGTYVIRGGAVVDHARSDDSVSVRVEARRALGVVAADFPGWTTAGTSYAARFTVRNRGNVAATIALAAATSRGTRCLLDATTLTLAPGDSAPVTVRVPTSADGHKSMDDLLELTITDRADDRVRAVASVRTSIIPQVGGWSENLNTMPAEMTVRAAGIDAGVSPFALRGAGLLGDGRTSVDFALNAPPRGRSPFGELPTSYVVARSGEYRVRLGDALYGFSPLTSSNALGRGASAERTDSGFTAGIYAEAPLGDNAGPSEVGAMIGTRAGAPEQLSAVMVQQQNAGGERDRVYSVGGTARLGDAATVSAEQAASDSAGGGFASQARIGGTVGVVNYNAGYLHGDASFRGPQRGTAHEDLMLSTQHWHGVALTGAGNVQNSLFTSSVAAVRERSSEARAGVELNGLATVEYGRLDRTDDDGTVALSGVQRGVRINSNVPLGRFGVSGTIEEGTATAMTSGLARSFLTVGGFARYTVAGGSLSLFGQHSDGNALGGGGQASTSGGASAQVHITESLQLSMTGTFASLNLAGGPSSGGWFGQGDARLEYKLPNQSIVSLRAHQWQHPELQGALATRIVYVEMRTPLRLPTGLRHDPGRAQGRVVDAESGAPLAGTLVRLGGQSAVTDREGRVVFSGLEAATYQVSVDAGAKSTGDMLLGDASVEIPKDSHRPTSFSVAVAHGARLMVSVRQVAYAATMGPSADSLVDAGDARGAVVELRGTRDTVYQTADDNGRVDFGDVAPGKWTLAVTSSETGARAVTEMVVLQPGDRRDVTLRVVPRRKTVTVMEDSVEIRATPSPSPSAPAGASPPPPISPREHP